MFLFPSLAGMIVFYLWPFLRSVGYAFTDKTINGEFSGLSNFISLVSGKSYQIGVINTLIFIGLSLPGGLALSLILSLCVNSFKKAGKLAMLLLLIPLALPSGSTVFFWKSVFSAKGALNAMLVHFGQAPVDWLDTSASRVVIIAIYLWKSLGYSIVLFSSALRSIPKEYSEASSIDGAGAISRLFLITLPCLAPTIILATIMGLINSFKIFKEIYVLTGSYPNESIYMTQHFLNNMFTALNYQKLSAATMLLALAVSLVSQGLFWLERRVSP
ncbi:MAG: sugar ABC transporter permease [Clostridiales bacterium]|nr:sugar ABC transporter permease [Clostridiales bacterium]